MTFQILNEQKFNVISDWPVGRGGLLADGREGGGRDADGVAGAGGFLGVGRKVCRGGIVSGRSQNAFYQRHWPILGFALEGFEQVVAKDDGKMLFWGF